MHGGERRHLYKFSAVPYEPYLHNCRFGEISEVRRTNATLSNTNSSWYLSLVFTLPDDLDFLSLLTVWKARKSASLLGITDQVLSVWMQDYMDIPAKAFQFCGVLISTESRPCFRTVIQFGESA